MIAVCLLAKPMQQACLTKDQYSSLTLVATDSLQQVASPAPSGLVCKQIFTSKGYCVSLDSIQSALKALKESRTKKELVSQEGIVKKIKEVKEKVQKVAKDAAAFKKGGASNPKSPAMLQGQNAPASQNPAPPSSDKNPKRVPKDKLNLNSNNLDRLQRASDKLNNVDAFLAGNANAGKRQNCQKAKFRLMIGAFCVVSAGSASDNVVVDVNGKISSIKINTKSAEKFISACADQLIQACDLNSLVQAAASSSQDSSNVSAAVEPASPAYCSYVADLQSCAATPSTCKDEVKNAVLQSGIAPFDDLINKNLDLAVLADTFNNLDLSLSSRRLQALSTVSFAPSSSASNFDDIAADSNLSDDSVEQTLAVPDVLKSSARLLNLMAVLVFGYFF